MPRPLLLLTVVMASLLTGRATAEELQRVQYNHPGLVVDLGVGLWAWPLPMDYDADGDLDLVVACPDKPFNGTWLFENPGDGEGQDGDRAEEMPVFKPPVKVGPGRQNMTVSYPNGRPRVLVPAEELTGFLEGDWEVRRKLYSTPRVHQGTGNIRANQWSYVDYDGDGAMDLVAGQGYWGDYGWDDAFNERGEWTRGPLHGFVYLLRNTGTSDQPDYAKPVQVTAGGGPVDVYGMPSPNFADFDADGDLDLLCGDFIDGLTYFQNVGTRTAPKYAAGRELMRDDQPDRPLEMPLCMIVVVAIDWDADGDTDLVVGQEDGRVALIEHSGRVEDGMPVLSEPRFFRQQAADVKFGALVTPVGFDWDGDGDEDLICGNTAGEIGFIENLAGGKEPRWAAPRLLKAGGETVRIQAGLNGSIQGPAERKWGYTTLAVADWDHDGRPDIVANSIWGQVIWYRNIGTPTEPKLAAAEPVQVQWPGQPPAPAWTWWKPTAGELATQWRTTPFVADWNGDGLRDLIILDHEGYLALFRRTRGPDGLTLQPGERIFTDKAGRPLRLNDKRAGGSGRRKLCLVDWDGDGRRDLLINSTSASLLRNLGETDGRTAFDDQRPLSDHKLAGHTTSPTTVDWDGDGIRDLLIGAEDGFLYHMPNPRSRQAE